MSSAPENTMPPPGCTAVRVGNQEAWDGTCPCGATFGTRTEGELLTVLHRHWRDKHEPAGLRNELATLRTRLAEAERLLGECLHMRSDMWASAGHLVRVRAFLQGESNDGQG